MPYGWYGSTLAPVAKARRIGRPDRGDRAKAKAGRKAARVRR